MSTKLVPVRTTIGKIIVGGYKSTRKIKVNHTLAGFAGTLRLLGVYGLREQEEKPTQRPGRMPSDFRNDEVYRTSFRSELNDNDWTDAPLDNLNASALFRSFF